jgi:hypothetical protein
MLRVLGTVVDPDTDATVRAGPTVIPGADADVSTEIIPALTLSYFFNKNLAVELFCCFAKHEIHAKGTIAPLGEIADSWIFPPALTPAISLRRLGCVEARRKSSKRPVTATSRGSRPMMVTGKGRP